MADPSERVTSPPEKRGDIVYTPDWCAADMVSHFAPSGIVLDPCRGRGAFHDLLPGGSPWCEITDGVDFFEFSRRVDWVIGNPPYSMTRQWFRHSYTEIAAERGLWPDQVAVMLASQLVLDEADDAAYRRVCERKGLLPL